MAKKLFVKAPSLLSVAQAIESNTLNSHIVFIEEAGRESILAGNTLYRAVPSGGTEGQVLTTDYNGELKWDTSINVLDTLSYGVSWKTNVPDPKITRIGNMLMHKELPIQSGMRGCVYNPKTKKVSYWLDKYNWRKKEVTEYFYINDVSSMSISGPDTASIYTNTANLHLAKGQYLDTAGYFCKILNVSSTSVSVKYNLEELGSATLDDIRVWVLEDSGTIGIGSNLSGYDGEVMVYVPSFYIKSWEKGNYNREVRISQIKIDDSWEFQPAVFIGAYKDTVLRTVPENMGYLSTLNQYSPVSIENDSNYCVGGDGNLNISGQDTDRFKSNRGKPVNRISRSTYREDIQNTGKQLLSYKQYKNILYWLYIIEYANFNSQDTFNTDLNPEGFRQGGLGNGITGLSGWSSYNEENPLCPNGYTNTLGNRTGVKLIEPVGLSSVYAIRWRGIENPFGDLYTCVDGIIIDSSPTYASNKVYTTTDPSKYGDSIDNIANMNLTGHQVRSNGTIVTFDLGSTAEIIPRTIFTPPVSINYKCDTNKYSGSSTATYNILALGGRLNLESTSCGLACFDTTVDANYSGSSVGFRSVALAE